MSENDQPTQSSDLGPKPDPEIEPGEPNPGGVDALPEPDDENASADLSIEKNPAIDQRTTPSLAEGEDTSTEATKNGKDIDPAEESPA